MIFMKKIYCKIVKDKFLWIFKDPHYDNWVYVGKTMPCFFLLQKRLHNCKLSTQPKHTHWPYWKIAQHVGIGFVITFNFVTTLEEKNKGFTIFGFLQKIVLFLKYVLFYQFWTWLTCLYCRYNKFCQKIFLKLNLGMVLLIFKEHFSYNSNYFVEFTISHAICDMWYVIRDML